MASTLSTSSLAVMERLSDGGRKDIPKQGVNIVMERLSEGGRKDIPINKE